MIDIESLTQKLKLKKMYLKLCSNNKNQQKCRIIIIAMT